MRIDVPYIQVTLHLLQAWLPKKMRHALFITMFHYMAEVSFVMKILKAIQHLAQIAAMD